MKKTTLAALAAFTTAATAQITNINLSVPTNIPPGLVQAEILGAARNIAAGQIQRASLAQLQSANTNLAGVVNGDAQLARQIMLYQLRQTHDLGKINALIAVLPTPTVSTNAP